MAIRLAKDLKNAPTPSNGFDLIFTEGLTYDLDELVAQRGRDNPDNELVIEVKKEAEIAEKVMTVVKKDVENEMYTTLDNEDCRKGVESIIQAVFNEYHCTYETANENIYSALNYRIRTYLKGLSKKYNLVFDIGFNINSENASITVNATADFASKVELTKRFNEFYDKYAEEFKKELENVDEGGLAITDNNKRRIVVKNQDYKDYLLTEKSSSSVKENFAPTRGPVIIWEDGTPDNTTEEDIHTIHDELNDLTDRINEAVIEVNNLEEAVDEMNEIKDNIEALSDLADAVEEDPQIFQNLKKEISTKADISSLVDYAKKDELFSGSYNDLTNKLNIINGVGTNSLEMKQDGNSGVFSFTDKNANATAIDSTLTGDITYGATGNFATVVGGKASAQGKRSMAQGTTTIAKGPYSHAEGDNSVALGGDSHAEGYATVASGTASHSEGSNTQATGEAAHSEGYFTVASGKFSHAEGNRTLASGTGSHATGNMSKAIGQNSTVSGSGTVAGYSDQFVVGRYNANSADALFEVGNGLTEESRRNAFTVYSDGHAELPSIGTSGYAVINKSYLEVQLENGLGTLKNYVDSNLPNYTDFSTATNLQNGRDGTTSVQGGTDSSADYDGDFVFGTGLRNTMENQAVFGKYNDNSNWENNRPLLMVGNGENDASRKNAFEVYLDGHIEAQTQGTTNNSVVIKSTLENYALKSDVNEKISELIGTAPDTLDTLHEIADVLQGDNGIIETIAGKANSEDVYLKTEADSKFLTEHQPLDAYALKSELFDGDYNKLTNIPDIPEKYDDEELRNLIAGKADSEHTHSEYLTEHQSLAGYATEKYVDDAVANIDTSDIDLSNYVQLEDGLIPETFLPSYVDDVIEFEKQVDGKDWLETALATDVGTIVFNNTAASNLDGGGKNKYYKKFLKNINGTEEELEIIEPVKGKIYVNSNSGITLRWSGSNLIEISKSLAIGETASTAFSGKRGVALETRAGEIEARLDAVEGTTAPDLSKYALKSDIPTVPTNVSAFTNDAGYLTEHQSLTDYAKKDELFSKSYNDLTDKPEIPEEYDDEELRNLISEKADKEHTHDQYLTEHQDISGKQDKLISGVNIATINGQSLLEGGDITLGGSGNIINPDVSNKPDLTGYATEEWVNEQGFLKEVPSTVALKTDIPTNISSFTNDTGYLTQHQDISGKANVSDLNALKSKVLAEGGATSLKLVEDISSYSALVVRGYINNNGINNRCFSFVLDPTLLHEGGLVTCTCGDDETGLYGAIFNVEFKYTSSTKTLAAARTTRHWVHETGGGTSLSGMIQRVVGLK